MFTSEPEVFHIHNRRVVAANQGRGAVSSHEGSTWSVRSPWRTINTFLDAIVLWRFLTASGVWGEQLGERREGGATCAMASLYCSPKHWGRVPLRGIGDSRSGAASWESLPERSGIPGPWGPWESRIPRQTTGKLGDMLSELGARHTHRCTLTPSDS